MSNTARVTVTLPIELVATIDRLESNRSRFIAIAVEQAIARRGHEAFLESIANPHPASIELASQGLADWASAARAEDADIVDPATGTRVQWVEGEGWIEEAK